MTGRSFTSAQIAALDAIANGASFEAAAVASGVTSRTLRRWRLAPLFGAAVQQARRAAREEAIATVRGLVPRAIAVLDEVLGDQAATAAVRLKAAEIVLRRALGEPGDQEPAVALREPRDPLVEAMERARGLEPTGEILWPREGP
jgi:hypothetical protein